MSGDDTLVLSGAEDVLSLNDTLVLSEDNNTFDDGNISDNDDQVSISQNLFTAVNYEFS